MGCWVGCEVGSAGYRTLTTLFVESLMYMYWVLVSNATPVHLPILALVAAPRLPSPVVPDVPVPATVVRMPLLAVSSRTLY